MNKTKENDMGANGVVNPFGRVPFPVEVSSGRRRVVRAEPQAVQGVKESKPVVDEIVRKSPLEYVKSAIQYVKDNPGVSKDGKRQYTVLHPLFSKIEGEPFYKRFNTYFGTDREGQDAIFASMVDKGMIVVTKGKFIYLPEEFAALKERKDEPKQESAKTKAVLAKYGL